MSLSDPVPDGRVWMGIKGIVAESRRSEERSLILSEHEKIFVLWHVFDRPGTPGGRDFRIRTVVDA